MNDTTRILAAVVLLLVAVLAGIAGPMLSGNEAKPLAPDSQASPQFVALFADAAGQVPPQAVAAAYESSVLFSAFADGIEWDGTRPVPKYQTVGQFDEFGATIKDFFLHGQRLSSAAPKLGPFVAAQFESTLGSNLDAPFSRPRVVTMLRQLSAGCKAVSDEKGK